MSNKIKLNDYKLIIVLVLILITGCADNQAEVELTISAAASLSDALAVLKLNSRVSMRTFD